MKKPASGRPGPSAGPASPRPPGDADLRMRMALRQTGFDASPRGGPAPSRPAPAGVPRAAAIAVRPAASPAAAPQPEASRALARRDWLLDVMERQRALSPMAGGVPRMRDLPAAAFLDHFYAPGRPVLIEGAIDDWPALKRWTPDYLREKIGAAPVEYQGGRQSHGDFELKKDRHRSSMPFDHFLDRHCLADDGRGSGNDAYITAYNSAANQVAFAPLAADMRPLDPYLTPAPGMMWMGPAGTFTPLHFDLTNNLLIQIVGRKKVTLLPPSETRLLAHRRHVFSDVHDIEDAARLARYPDARRARRFDIMLGPGEALFIPIGWWHQVRGLDFSVMLTATNFHWPNEGHQAYPG